MRPAAVAATIASVVLLAQSNAAETTDKPAPLPVIVFVPTAEPLGGERQVLQLLAAGHQAEAEALLEAQIAHFPKMLQLAGLVVHQKLTEADEFAAANRDEICAGQRTLFLLAACAAAGSTSPERALCFTLSMARGAERRRPGVLGWSGDSTRTR